MLRLSLVRFSPLELTTCCTQPCCRGKIASDEPLVQTHLFWVLYRNITFSNEYERTALVVPHWVVLNWETLSISFSDNFWANPKELGCVLKVIVQLFLGYMKRQTFQVTPSTAAIFSQIPRNCKKSCSLRPFVFAVEMEMERQTRQLHKKKHFLRSTFSKTLVNLSL